MLDLERIEQIRIMLQEKHSVYVDKLATHFNVSKMTIRRDLTKLEKTYPDISRCHGGAILIKPVNNEDTFTEKSTSNKEIKKLIAQKAYELIKPGMNIYIDAGTSCYALSHLLDTTPLDISITTNDLRTAMLLGDAGYNVKILGGNVENKTLCITGVLSELYLDKLNFDICFMGATSINPNLEICTPTRDKVILKRMIIGKSKLKVLLTDKSKFYRHSTYTIYKIDDFNNVITDKLFTNKELISLNACKIINI